MIKSNSTLAKFWFILQSHIRKDQKIKCYKKKKKYIYIPLQIYDIRKINYNE